MKNCEHCAKVLEKLEEFSNKFDAMNSYYAQALSKTIITKEDLTLVIDHIRSIKNEVVTDKKRVVKRIIKKKITRKNKK